MISIGSGCVSASPLDIALSALARMMATGEPLALADVVEPRSRPGRAAVRKRLVALVDALPYANRTDGGRGHTERFWWTWPSSETTRPEQVWALAAARALLASFSESEVGRVLTDLLDNHRARVTGHRVPQVDLSRMFYASTQLLNPQGLDPDVVDKVASAIANRRTLHFGYTRFTGRNFSFEVEPWTLLLAHDGIYVYGRCVGCDDADQIDRRRVFTLARMRGLRNGGEFTYPEVKDHNPRDLFEFCWGLMVPAPEAGGPVDVVLRLVPGWSAYLNHQKLHATQGKPSADADGWISIKMRLHVTYDLVHWIRGHGAEIQVIEPQALAQWVASCQGGDGYTKWVLAHQAG